MLRDDQPLELSEKAKAKITRCRTYLDELHLSGREPVYGVNTGFGALCNTIIDSDQTEELQRNLLLSHACGMGDEVPLQVVKLMLLLKIQGLSYGHSGVQLQTVNRLCDFYNEDILPVVYQQGSLGASGDLAPLSHLALPLIGEGFVMYRGKRISSAEALKNAGLSPIKLKSKEGLALINGTQFMSAYLTLCVLRCRTLFEKADNIAAMSLDAFDARPEPFNDLTHLVRPHSGQLFVAQNIRNILSGSELQRQAKIDIQDPYSFRCIPQIHGASRDTLEFVEKTLTTELHSVTDNPIIFPEEGRIISGGNFHGQPLALAADFLAIAASEIGSISERRIYKLIGGLRGLPPFLAKKPGLNSGFMIPQYTAAGIVSQNKQLCTPASVDSIDSSNGQEDHVSMGANAVTKCFRVIENLQSILAIEYLVAAQALDFRRPSRSSEKVEKLHELLRKEIPFAERDTLLHESLKKARRLLD
ncbi:MAG: histidine ammonia-lyase [Crocinitomicaceae bacterium]|nr:histidine ammonia-lyase [Crocinitomicaceae bacterium]